MSLASADDVRNRFAERARAWRVDVERLTETATALVAFGERDQQPVVLKVAKNGADEWRAGEMLAAFDGKGVARVYEHASGAMLLEHGRDANRETALMFPIVHVGLGREGPHAGDDSRRVAFRPAGCRGSGVVYAEGLVVGTRALSPVTRNK